MIDGRGGGREEEEGRRRRGRRMGEEETGRGELYPQEGFRRVHWEWEGL